MHGSFDLALGLQQLMGACLKTIVPDASPLTPLRSRLSARTNQSGKYAVSRSFPAVDGFIYLNAGWSFSDSSELSTLLL